MAPSKTKQHISATRETADLVRDLARGFFGGDTVRTELSASGRTLKSPVRDVRNTGLDADRS